YGAPDLREKVRLCAPLRQVDGQDEVARGAPAVRPGTGEPAVIVSRQRVLQELEVNVAVTVDRAAVAAHRDPELAVAVEVKRERRIADVILLGSAAVEPLVGVRIITELVALALEHAVVVARTVELVLHQDVTGS